MKASQTYVSLVAILPLGHCSCGTPSLSCVASCVIRQTCTVSSQSGRDETSSSSWHHTLPCSWHPRTHWKPGRAPTAAGHWDARPQVPFPTGQWHPLPKPSSTRTDYLCTSCQEESRACRAEAGGHTLVAAFRATIPMGWHVGVFVCSRARSVHGLDDGSRGWTMIERSECHFGDDCSVDQWISGSVGRPLRRDGAARNSGGRGGMVCRVGLCGGVLVARWSVLDDPEFVTSSSPSPVLRSGGSTRARRACTPVTDMRPQHASWTDLAGRLAKPRGKGVSES